MVFKGSAAALVTPFRQNGTIDFVSLAGLVDFQLQNGSDALVVCGTNGEPSTMTLEEAKWITKAVVEQVAGRVPVIAGIGGDSTKEAIQAIQVMGGLGVDALLCVTPYYNKTTQRGLVAHYSALSAATDLPVVLYNAPAYTGLNMLPSTVAQLADVPNIAAVVEASGDLGHIMEISRVCRGKLQIICGNDDAVFPMVCLGARSIISVAANIVPQQMHDLVVSTQNGDLKTGRHLQLNLLPLVNLLFCEASPITVKAALTQMGMLLNEVRLPLVQLSKDQEELLVAEMKRQELI